ncbi:MAG: FAD-dependent monooxygenase [Lentisphaeria bacterium]|nr:FAD-dependent monooxygenase [Lentisphaeria bacterium]
MKISIEKMAVKASGKPRSLDYELHPVIAACCGIRPEDIIDYTIVKRSIDARQRPDVKLLYSLIVELDDKVRPKRFWEPAPAEIAAEPPVFHCANPPLHPVIVGAGPAGLFCGLILAMAGCKPVILDRGRDVVHRRADIDRFFATRELNEESNLLFGEGGAGTWSDGKLYTRIRDPRIQFVLREMIEAGAPENIAYYSHPHVGSDLLPGVVANLRKKIEGLGGFFRWDSRAESLIVRNGVCRGVILAGGEKLESPLVVSACGHSARDFILASIQAGATFRMKGFQIGCRIEHPQDFINWMQFGVQETIPALGSAEYNMVSRPAPDGRSGGVTTFCMCPGGEIIPATPTRERLCTNGMSNSARSGRFANAALVTAIGPEVFRSPQDAYAFLDSLEHRAFDAGGGDYVCPAQKAADFLRGNTGKLPKHSSWKFGLKAARLDVLLPDPVSRALRRALVHFDRQAEGYVRYGTLLGVETRVSSPVRFERDEATRQNPLRNFYPVGEGAGLAGGITSSAIDGILTAESILKRPADIS